MAKFTMHEMATSGEVVTARVCDGTGAGNAYSDADVGKFVKLAGDSRYAMCAVGDAIEGRVSSIEVGSQDGFSIGGVVTEMPLMECVADGLVATPGTGTLAIGDYVVCGTVVAKGTALANYRAGRVCQASILAATLNNAAAFTGAANAKSHFVWRVVSLGQVGTGAVGTAIVIQSVE